MPAAQMAANAVAATSGWQPYGLHGAPAFQTLPRLCRLGMKFFGMIQYLMVFSSYSNND